MVIYITGSVLILVLVVYSLYLWRELKKLRKNFKELLQESRKQTPTSQRNKENIYFHLNKNFMIEYMNDVACHFFNTDQESIANQPALGRIMEDSPANQAYLNSCFHRLLKNPETINNEIVITPQKNQKVTMKIRIRPILNEILDCVGMSIILKDISEADKLKHKLKSIQEQDILNSNILNETALFQKLEKDFNRCKRYNQDFSLVVVELKDVYDFVCKGIDFETGDKLIIQAGKICDLNGGARHTVGRFEKTKFAILLPKESRETAADIAQNMYYPLIKLIQSIGVDRYNAEMFVISYTNRKNFNETTDTLLGRVKRHISSALRKRDYGIKSSDKDKNGIL